MTTKQFLIGLGITGSITVLGVLGMGGERNCPKDEVKVWVNKEAACIEDTLENRRLALFNDLVIDKVDEKGNHYNMEISNWGVFWRTVMDLKETNQLTNDEVMKINTNKFETLKILNPNK